jgi:hypothetical protein
LHIGLTYDRLHNETIPEWAATEPEVEETITSLAACLERLGHQVSRIGNIFDLNAQLANGKRWDIVFNTSQGTQGVGKECHIPAVLDIYEIPHTLADAFSLSVMLHPGMVQSIVSRAGIPSTEIPLGGRKLIVGITGSQQRARILGIMEESTQRAFTHNDEKIARTAIAAWNSLGCRDAGCIHLRMDAAGTPHFVHVEPLASLHPGFSDLVTLSRAHGISYANLVRIILEEALVRSNISTKSDSAPNVQNFTQPSKTTASPL